MICYMYEIISSRTIVHVTRDVKGTEQSGTGTCSVPFRPERAGREQQNYFLRGTERYIGMLYQCSVIHICQM